VAVVIELTARAITLTPGVRSGAAERCPISREHTGTSRCTRSWCPDRSPELEISLRDSVTLRAFENTSKVRTTMPWTCSTRDNSVTSPPLVTARSTRTPPRNHRPSLGTRARLSDQLCKSSASAAMNNMKHIGCNVHSSCGHHRQGSTGHRGSQQGGRPEYARNPTLNSSTSSTSAKNTCSAVLGDPCVRQTIVCGTPARLRRFGSWHPSANGARNLTRVGTRSSRLFDTAPMASFSRIPVAPE